jgi:hypothetical protein
LAITFESATGTYGATSRAPSHARAPRTQHRDRVVADGSHGARNERDPDVAEAVALCRRGHEVEAIAGRDARFLLMASF